MSRSYTRFFLNTLGINQRFHISNISTPKNKATYDLKKKINDKGEKERRILVVNL
jgi:hypothetical protein